MCEACRAIYNYDFGEPVPEPAPVEPDFDFLYDLQYDLQFGPDEPEELELQAIKGWFDNFDQRKALVSYVHEKLPAVPAMYNRIVAARWYAQPYPISLLAAELLKFKFSSKFDTKGADYVRDFHRKTLDGGVFFNDMFWFNPATWSDGCFGDLRGISHRMRSNYPHKVTIEIIDGVAVPVARVPKVAEN